MTGIYKITNQLTNEVYIGQSIHIEQRWREHKQEVKNNNNQAIIYQAMRNYGIENFSFKVLEECECDSTILNEREKYWISVYDSFHNGYNMTSGGQGESGWIYNPDSFYELWDKGYSSSEIAETLGCCIQLVSARLKGYKDFGRVACHQRAYYRDNPNNLIHQYNLSGEYVKSYSGIREAERVLNVPHSCLISQCLNKELKTAYGFQWSREKKDKIDPVAPPNGKLIQCIETGDIFLTSRQAAAFAGLKSHTGIVDHLKGRKKSAGKHPITGEKLHWKYIED